MNADELHEILTSAVLQMHQFCRENIVYAGHISLSGKVTVITDTSATVDFHTSPGLDQTGKYIMATKVIMAPGKIVKCLGTQIFKGGHNILIFQP